MERPVSYTHLDVYKRQVLSRSEQEALRHACISQGELPALVGLYTGMRLGEVCALKWTDIDWEKCTISVKRTAQRTTRSGGELRTELTVGAPKRCIRDRVVIEFFFKIIQRPFAADLLVGQQVGKNLQKVGFTAAKEAGNPHADFVRGPVDPLFVMIVKGPEVLLELSGDDVFLQLLPPVFVVGLHDLNDAVNGTIDVL